MRREARRSLLWSITAGAEAEAAPLASFLLWGSHGHVRVMGHLSAVAQQLARRPLSKGTTVCFGHRWLQINKMDDTIWIRTWNTPWYLFFPQWFTSALECDPPVDDGDTVFFSWIVIIQYFFTLVWHIVRLSSYLLVPQNSGRRHTSPILIPFQFIEGLPHLCFGFCHATSANSIRQLDFKQAF